MFSGWFYTESKTRDTTVFDSALVWQKKQQRDHFVNCKIYNDYLLMGEKYTVPENNVTKGKNSQYYHYCFGNFSSFISNEVTVEEVRETIRSLLNLYDMGKGYSRLLLGDPEHISMLKTFVNVYTMKGLREYDFKPFIYEYDKIHAHTMTQYSLSTLIMLIVSHLVNTLLKKENAKYEIKCFISAQLCKKSYDDKIFQDFECRISSPISQLEWPQKIYYCEKCNQACDNLWGNFNCCLNCHLNSVCVKCGSVNGIRKINLGSYPYCEEHAKDF